MEAIGAYPAGIIDIEELYRLVEHDFILALKIAAICVIITYGLADLNLNPVFILGQLL